MQIRTYEISILATYQEIFKVNASSYEEALELINHSKPDQIIFEERDITTAEIFDHYAVDEWKVI